MHITHNICQPRQFLQSHIFIKIFLYKNKPHSFTVHVSHKSIINWSWKHDFPHPHSASVSKISEHIKNGQTCWPSRVWWCFRVKGCLPCCCSHHYYLSSRHIILFVYLFYFYIWLNVQNLVGHSSTLQISFVDKLCFPF